MNKQTIPLFFFLFLFLIRLQSQTPVGISLPEGFSFQQNFKATTTQTAAGCNFAGTFSAAAFSGQSNDLITTPSIADTLFLCLGDQILLDHNGDEVLSGDPQPSTTAGVGWAFYQCPPTISGDNLQLVLNDVCLWPNAPTGMWVATGQNNGDILLKNEAQLQNNPSFNPFPNTGDALVFYFAPITLDNFAGAAFEAASGTAPGPCINVNIAQAFPLAYLNPVSITSINANAGNDCIGRFLLEGGYPELYNNAHYQIDIFLASDPSVKAIIQTPPSQWKYMTQISFFAPQPGVYNILISDGKSCDFSGTINMSACTPADNVIFSTPDVAPTPGEDFCLPIRVQNFKNIGSGGFSLNWDKNVLQYTGLNYVNPLLDTTYLPMPAGNGSTTTMVLNPTLITEGKLGVVFFNSLGFPINLEKNEVLLEICFKVLGQVNQCSAIQLSSDPAQLSFETANGPLSINDQIPDICIKSFTHAFKDSSCLGTANLVVQPVTGTYPIAFTFTQLPTGPIYNTVLTAPSQEFTVLGVGNPNNVPIDVVICATDQNGLGVTVCDTFTVLIGTLGAQIEFVQPNCNGGLDGSVRAILLEGGLSVSNPGPQYTYQWTPNVPSPGSPVQQGVGVGQYSVTITDTNRDCSFSASGFLGQPTPLGLSANISTDSAGYGLVNLTAEGGTPPYQFAWSNGSTIEDQSNLFGGSYTCTLTDANGCTLTEGFTVPGPSSLREAAFFKTLSLLPNPAAEVATLRVALKTAQTLELSLFDVSGRKVWEKTSEALLSDDISLPVRDLPIGMYQLQIRVAGDLFGRVLVVQR